MVTKSKMDASDRILSRKRIYGYSRPTFFNIKVWQYLLIVLLIIAVPLMIMPRRQMVIRHYKNKGMFKEALAALSDTGTEPKSDSAMMLLSADLHQQAGNPDQAIEVLEKLLEKKPKNPKILTDLIDLYEGTRNSKKRLMALEHNERKNPVDTRSLKTLADDYAYQGFLHKHIETIVQLIHVEKTLQPEAVFSYIEDPEKIYEVITDPLIRAVSKELQRLAEIRTAQKHHPFLDELIRQLYTYRSNVIRKIQIGGPPLFPDQETAVIRLFESYVRTGMLAEGKAFAAILDAEWKEGVQNRLRLIRIMRWNREEAHVLAWLQELNEAYTGGFGFLFQAAQIALENGDVQTAIYMYEKIAQKNRGNLEIRFKLADLYLQTEDIRNAYTVYKQLAMDLNSCNEVLEEMLRVAGFTENRVIVTEAAGLGRKLCPNRPEILRTSAEMLLAAGAESEAIEAFTDYLKLNPVDVKAVDQLVDLYRWTNKTQKAYSILKRLVESTGSGRERLLKMAQTAAEAGDPALLKEAVSTATQRLPRDAVLRLKLGSLLTDNGLYPEAARIYRNHLDQTPEDTQALAQLKQLYHWTNQPERAADISAEASDRDQGNFQTALTAGVEYMEAGKTGKAILYFERASRIRPRHVPVRKHLAACYEWTGNIDQMVVQMEFLDQVGEIESRQKQLLARAYLDQKQSRLALKHLKPMEQQPALSVEPGLMLAEAYTISDQRTEAIRIYKRLGREHPHDAKLLARAGREVLWLQDPDSALDLFKAALNIEPNNRIALKEGGNAYVLKQDLHKAIRQLETYSRLFPDDYEVRFQLGELYFGTGQQHRAYKHYGRALALIRKAKRSTQVDGNQRRMN